MGYLIFQIQIELIRKIGGRKRGNMLVIIASPKVNKFDMKIMRCDNAILIKESSHCVLTWRKVKNIKTIAQRKKIFFLDNKDIH